MPNSSDQPKQGLERIHLLKELEQRVAASRAGGGQFALLVFNLKRFRELNIDFGHRVGDIVLTQVGSRIQEVLRPDDLLFRVGSDEYAVLLTQLKAPEVVQFAIVRMLDAIGVNFEVDGHNLGISAIAGAALFPDHADDCDGLLKAADAALYYAREQHRNYSIYDASIRLDGEKMAKLKGNLRNALDNNDLLLHYQPQVDLQQRTLKGCEALARWKHAEHGWIRPDIFIPLAERSEMIVTLTYWSLNTALREWFQYCKPCSSASIALNLSAKLLHSPEVVDLVSRAMNIWGAEPGSLVLEVTESAMMSDPKAALYTLCAFHEMGITLSIDDFGTGYSSLAYLKKLPVGELKIDKSFVQQMAEEKQDRKIVQSIIDLAHNLDMTVVAEGIENQQILDMLIGMGCDYGQGYFIARPMPFGELPSWAENSRWKKPGAVQVTE